jgi:Fe-S-cluster containining protein
MGVLDESRLLADAAESSRECGDCTACCTVLEQVELRKPMRCACEHIVRAGCRIYAERPAGCREFNCLWLRGALPADQSFRPDHLGVLLDGYRRAGTGEVRLAALEVWTCAFDAPAARSLIDGIAETRQLDLSFRDGTWETRGGATDARGSS